MRRWLPATLLLLLVGCGLETTTDIVKPGKPSGGAPTAGENTTTDSSEEAPATVPAEEAEATDGDAAASSAEVVSLVDDDGTEFQKYLEANRGKVILVDCWATWCGPCKEGFPNTVALHEKHKGEGLVVVSVSFDDLGEDDEEKKANRDAALAFLKEQKATFKNFLAKTGVGPESGEPFGVSIQLPAFRVIDRQGKDRLTGQTSGKELEQELEQLVETLLKEGA